MLIHHKISHMSISHPVIQYIRVNDLSLKISKKKTSIYIVEIMSFPMFIFIRKKSPQYRSLARDGCKSEVYLSLQFGHSHIIHNN